MQLIRRVFRNRTYTILSALFVIWIAKRKLFKKPRKSVVDKVIVITGAGSGLGRLFATKFADLGAKVALCDINENGLKETALLLASEQNKYLIHKADITKKNDIQEFINLTKRKLGTPYMLINNAGVVSGKRIEELTESDLRRTIEINLLGPMMLTSAVVPDMLKQGGHIVNVCSASAFVGVSKLTDYCASKAGLYRFTYALREEFRLRSDLTEEQSSQLRATAINPYFIATGMFNGVSYFPFLLPILTPDWVVDRAIDGILRDELEVNMPSSINLVPPIQSILPQCFSDMMSSFLGVSTCMEKFSGRATDGEKTTSHSK